MTEPLVRPIPERPDNPYRLGRAVHHDPRSRAYAFTPPAGVTLRTVHWDRAVPIFDQGQLGSCTGNAAAGWLATANTLRPGLTAAQGVPVDEDYAVALYARATQIDPYDGTWPPQDSGSDGLSVTKVLKERGLVDTYQHAFTVDAALAALMSGPVLVGTSWHQGMFTPDAAGVVTATGPVVGGHEYLLVGYDADAHLVTFANSWGTAWGVGGYGRMTVATLTALLADDGDATVPHPVVAVNPPPTPQPPGRFVQLDPDVAARVARAASRRGLISEDWVNKHLRTYFRDA